MDKLRELNRLDKFNMNDLINKFFIYITGGEKSGKTSLVLQILNYHRNYDVVYFIVSRDNNYKNETFFYSDKKIITVNDFNLDILKHISIDPRKKLVIFDDVIDCLYDLMLNTEKDTLELFFKLVDNKNTSIIVVSQYFLFLEFLKKVDYLFLTKDDENIIKRHCNESEFLEIYRNIINLGVAIVLDVNSNEYYRYDSDIIIINCVLCTDLPDKIVI